MMSLFDWKQEHMLDDVAKVDAYLHRSALCRQGRETYDITEVDGDTVVMFGNDRHVSR